LIELFKGLSHLERPAILHVYTKKGKGFGPAERDGRRFHSTGPFKLNGDLLRSEPDRQTFTQVFGVFLTELAEKDERIVAITSAMCDGTGLGEFRKRFGSRFYDVGIAESAAVDIAAGLARSRMKPVVCIYSTFLQRSFDQIFQEIALQNLPVVFCIDRAGVVGSDGPTHHGLMDVGFLRMMPNMVVTAPANAIEVKLALEFALSSDRPVAIRYPKDLVPSGQYDLSGCEQEFELGKSVAIRRSSGSTITIASYGSMLSEAVAAAGKLEQEGIVVDVINARFAAPIDEELVRFVEQGKSIITVEDHGVSCGFGSAVCELAAARKPAAAGAIVVLAAPRRFIRHDARSKQLVEAGVDAEMIVWTARELVTRRLIGSTDRT
jgi:1-deoxy-D-xylulose-5-phosphate synthase